MLIKDEITGINERNKAPNRSPLDSDNPATNKTMATMPNPTANVALKFLLEL